jgi:hypothetical protein
MDLTRALRRESTLLPGISAIQYPRGLAEILQIPGGSDCNQPDLIINKKDEDTAWWRLT